MPATQATTIAQRRKMMLLVEGGHTNATIGEQVRYRFGQLTNGFDKPSRVSWKPLKVVMVVHLRGPNYDLIPWCVTSYCS